MYLSPSVLEHSGYLRKSQTNCLKIIHITDTHLVDHPDATFNDFNTRGYLEAVMTDSLERYPDTDFLLFTGDISQTGSESSYKIFQSLIQQYQRPVYCVPGNHDTPQYLSRIIPHSPDNSVNIIRLGSFSLILLSSWVEDQHHGMISGPCLEQLDDYLNGNNDLFNIIALHHPPALTNSKWLDELGLKNRGELINILQRHGRNSLVLSGHVHQEIDICMNNLRMLTTPSTCYQFKANSSHMCRLETPQPAYRFIQLTAHNGIHTKVHYLQ